VKNLIQLSPAQPQYHSEKEDGSTTHTVCVKLKKN